MVCRSNGTHMGGLRHRCLNFAGAVAASQRSIPSTFAAATWTAPRICICRFTDGHPMIDIHSLNFTGCTSFPKKASELHAEKCVLIWPKHQAGVLDACLAAKKLAFEVRETSETSTACCELSELYRNRDMSLRETANACFTRYL